MDYRATSLVKARFAKAKMLPSLEERFWLRVQKGAPEQCWPWTGARMNNGYGYIDINRHGDRRILTAHRLSVEISTGTTIPDGMHVLHACDNPRCVNPAHLRIGSHQDNMRDMASKGRQAGGMRNGRRKLNADQVTEIRVSEEPHKVLAVRYDVHTNEISRIKRRLTWRSLP